MKRDTSKHLTPVAQAIKSQIERMESLPLSKPAGETSYTRGLKKQILSPTDIKLGSSVEEALYVYIRDLQAEIARLKGIDLDPNHLTFDINS